ncbi:MAG TPA: hypothetical protein VL096_02720 [Pirellulaceae bacterium]|nr:hypothetical protein [Pirellulaceae bacterium]
MGFFDKVKGFLNVGGVTVKILQVENPFPAGDSCMKGTFVLTSDSDRTVLSTAAKFYKKTTKKEDGKETTETDTLGSCSTKDYMFNDEYPFEIAKGERKELSFIMINVDCPPSLAAQSGVVGAIGKLAAFASNMSGEKTEFFVEVTADVKGTPFDPSDTIPVQVVEKKQ